LEDEDDEDDATTLLRLLGQAPLKWQRRRAVIAFLAVAVISEIRRVDGVE
jgi:hypothetical protein